jgi:beta-lactamase superfamily II metal-dependent hydrolase
MKHLLVLVFAASLCAQTGGGALAVYAIDVEGGKSTLFVSPSGESMLVDAGYAGFNGRDAGRIAAAAQTAGVKQIDYLVITHYHQDHVGGVFQLASKLPIRNFVDHGRNFETVREVAALYSVYTALRGKGIHIVVKAGDTVPIQGIQVKVVSASGEAIPKPLPGAAQPNPLCASFRRQAPDLGENARSIGIVVTYGDFRLADLGDLPWNQEFDLACPVNKLGAVDVYLTTHHGDSTSGSPQMVQALHPKVAIMNNGPRKGGSIETWRTIHGSPGFLDLWQLHFAAAAGKDHNAPGAFIANTAGNCQGKWIRLTARQGGTFTVLNSGNNYEKTYQK